MPFRILWGFPCPEYGIPGSWLRWACRFMDATTHTVSMPLVASQSGTLDLARSWMIEVARNNQVYDGLLQMDLDTYIADSPDPGNPGKPFVRGLDEIVEFLQDDMAQGYDAVGCAPMSADGVPNWGFPSVEAWANFDPAGPTEASWVSGKFLFLTRKALDGLQVLEWAKSTVMRAEPDDKGQPMFCRMNLPKEGEDISLCRNIRESGFKLCVDTRIPVGVAKKLPQFVSKAVYQTLRQNARASLSQRAERLARND